MGTTKVHMAVTYAEHSNGVQPFTNAACHASEGVKLLWIWGKRQPFFSIKNTTYERVETREFVKNLAEFQEFPLKAAALNRKSAIGKFTDNATKLKNCFANSKKFGTSHAVQQANKLDVLFLAFLVLAYSFGFEIMSARAS